MKIKSVVPDRVPGPAKLFLVATALNGMGNGMINVVFQLYLISLGFESAAIGTMAMMNPLGAAILTVPAGVLADRYGKKQMMISGFIMIGFSVCLFLVAKTIEMFMLTFLLIGLSNATFVVLTPLYSSFFDNEDMDRAFGLMGFINVITMSAGSIIGFIPPMLVKNYGFSLQSSYWTVIAIAGAIILVQMPFYVMSIREVVDPKRRNGVKFALRSRGIVGKFFLLSLLSAIGGNVFFNLFPFYVNSKFGIESDALGTLFFVSNFVSAGANALAPRFSRRLGALKTIAVVMGLATPFYLLIPLAPSFALLSALYILRLGFRTIAEPLMSSLFMRMLREDEKSTANSVRQMAFQSGGALAPWIGGQLMETSLDLPIYLGAGFYAVFAPLSYMLLRGEKEIVVEPAMPS
jgi:MFS family permease